MFPNWLLYPMIVLSAMSSDARAGGGEGKETCLHKLGPASKQQALLAQLEQSYRFVIRGTEQALNRIRHEFEKGDDSAKVEDLGAFDSLAMTLRVSDARQICSWDGVDQVWYLSPVLADPYVRILMGLQYVKRTLKPPAVINMSLGPPAELYPLLGDTAEPMQHAAQVLANQGMIIVMAIGNNGPAATPGLTNPWCQAESVICVGAASKDGNALWEASSVGVPEDPKTWPTVVAHGIDVVGPWPTDLPKPAHRRAYDLASAEFLESVPAEKYELYTLMTGSSQAAAQVSRAASQIVHFITNLIEQNQASSNQRLFSLSIPRERFESGARLGPRWTGDVVIDSEDFVEVEYRLVEPWKLVKQLLVDTALPMPEYDPHQVGAGFVSPALIEEQFGQFGIADGRVAGVKVE